MLDEVMERLKPADGEVYCDATFGAGGYTRAILDAANCTVLALDRDPGSIKRAETLAAGSYGQRLRPIHGRFGNMQSLVETHTELRAPCLDGIVFDVGVSSMQIDDAMRGFSYRFDGPLDMRMNSAGDAATAADLVNGLDAESLARIITTFGGEKHARRIARAVEAARVTKPILRTQQLTDIVLEAHHCSLRIEVNDELGELRQGLIAAEHLLKPGGRLVAVTFHSLEERAVKDFLYRCSGRRPVTGKTHDRAQRKKGRSRKEQAAMEASSIELMEESWMADSEHHRALSSTKDAEAEEGGASFTLVERRVVRPSSTEADRNSRSKSACLRAAIRTHAPPLAPRM
ncbi:MraW methylase family-domain-containing protein [Thamnocephalis sphaerospora]|uniref:MraW methylase family-domain-containing protein n=1 Tax=Thamnocephalis sphaerospora TaxID=78915 RepID=A0A4P9XTV1_9FUNG|nr:MraW methylase family-domain-containing protein [Thamnocephalis sphaerospora]|eukprot:RKP09618.1 MraW methylase family-domain-containing protein [Thamnocephalis sphaerospora]